MRVVRYGYQGKKNNVFQGEYAISIKDMLLNTLLTKYRWLIANVPETLHHNRYRWESCLRGLSPLDIANLRMNISAIIHHRHLIEDEFDNHDPETEEFDCLCEIHYRLVELSLRLTS